MIIPSKNSEHWVEYTSNQLLPGLVTDFQLTKISTSSWLPSSNNHTCGVECNVNQLFSSYTCWPLVNWGYFPVEYFQYYLHASSWVYIWINYFQIYLLASSWLELFSSWIFPVISVQPQLIRWSNQLLPAITTYSELTRIIFQLIGIIQSIVDRKEYIHLVNCVYEYLDTLSWSDCKLTIYSNN